MGEGADRTAEPPKYDSWLRPGNLSGWREVGFLQGNTFNIMYCRALPQEDEQSAVIIRCLRESEKALGMRHDRSRVRRFKVRASLFWLACFYPKAVHRSDTPTVHGLMESWLLMCWPVPSAAGAGVVCEEPD